MSVKRCDVADVELWLGDLAKLVQIEHEGDYVTIRKDYDYTEKGKQDWRTINNIVTEHDGEWISNGKLSHWRFKAGAEKKAGTVQFTHTKLIMEITQHMVNAGNELEMATSKMKKLKEG